MVFWAEEGAKLTQGNETVWQTIVNEKYGSRIIRHCQKKRMETHTKEVVNQEPKKKKFCHVKDYRS